MVFIVIAVGVTAGMLIPASLGAAAAGVLVICLGVVVHRPLARVPENALKFLVGVLLSTFGIFWVGEGTGLGWPGNDPRYSVSRSFYWPPRWVEFLLPVAWPYPLAGRCRHEDPGQSLDGDLGAVCR